MRAIGKAQRCADYSLRVAGRLPPPAFSRAVFDE
jgi:hypothetical protein